jgi:hypothetical protein
MTCKEFVSLTHAEVYMTNSFRRVLKGFILLLALILVFPAWAFSAEYRAFPVNSDLQKIFSDISGGGTGKIRLINKNDEA